MSKLEFGIFDSFGPFEMAEFPAAADVYEAHIQEAQAAEQLGYRYYFFIEHQNSPTCYVTAPNIYLTALASRTRDLRFGLMIYQLPFADRNYKRTFLAPRHWWVRRWGPRARRGPRAAGRC